MSRPVPLTEAQSDWFVREVKRCVALGIPLGCCDEWPECSHTLAWYEAYVAEEQKDEWVEEQSDE